ncbi:MAG: hypothetical protein ACLUR5_03280 [Eubacterium ventriosum]
MLTTELLQNFLQLSQRHHTSTKYTFADTLAKGLTYNKDSVTLYWYDSKADADINDTAKAVATWTQDKNKFTVTVQDNKMTVAITEDGLSEINPN